MQNITIIDIYKEIEKKKDFLKEKLQEEDQQNNWKPEKIKDYILPKINFQKLTEPNKKKYSKVLSFIDLLKYIRYNEGCTKISIPTTNKRFLSICGNNREVSRIIQFMKQLNLIEVYDDNYQFNSTNKKYNKSKTYKYYYENEVKLKEFCKINEINKINLKNFQPHNKKDFENCFFQNFDTSSIRFSSKLQLLKIENISIKQFENLLSIVLYDNYPYLEYYQTLADKINKNYYKNYPEMELCFIPTFTWNKKNTAIRKIGIRCTNTLVNAKNTKEDKDNNFFGNYKEDVLKKYKLNLHKDIKSSIPRLTLSINKGKWITEDIDIYETIYNKYKQYKRNQAEENKDIYNTVVDNFFGDMRNAVKSLHMRGYFDDDVMLGVHTRRVMQNVIDKVAVDNEMKIFKKSIVESEGGILYDNEIFLHESCICIDVLYELLKEGYFVWNCYDCFYARKKGVSQEQFETHVAELIEQKANEYILKIINK